MSLNDKIIKALKKHGALSSEEIENMLEREFGTEKSKRTIQRHVKDLVDKGRLKPNPTSGREQTYSLCLEEPQDISEIFLSKFWNELFLVREELHDRGGGPFMAFLRLRSLVKMLPEHLKEKLEPDIVKVIPRVNFDWRRIEADRPMSLSEREKEGYQIVTELIGKVSTLLHEELGIEGGRENEDV